MLPRPLQFIIAMVTHAINKQMARRIENLLEEVRMLREVYAETAGRKRISFTDEQRRHLRLLLREFVAHYLKERFHQGLGGQLIVPRHVSENDNSATGAIRCRSHLGGLLNFYHREAE